MGIVQHFDFLTNGIGDKLPHLIGKWTEVTDRGSLLDAGGKGDGVSTAFCQYSGAQHHKLSGTSAAVDKFDRFNCTCDLLKYTPSFPDYPEIDGTGTIILGLHASGDANSYDSFLTSDLISVG